MGKKLTKREGREKYKQEGVEKKTRTGKS